MTPINPVKANDSDEEMGEPTVQYLLNSKAILHEKPTSSKLSKLEAKSAMNF